MSWVAGTFEDVQKIDNWFIVDIGFSNSSKSCGVVTVESGNAPAGLSDKDGNIYYGALIKKFQDFAEAKIKIGLVIEAPLSIAFNNTPDKVRNGNPVGRKEIEQENSSSEKEENIQSSRYWYVGAGATVTLATINFLNQIKVLSEKLPDIYLYEGLVSFKNPNESKQSHWADASDLHDAIQYFKKLSTEPKPSHILDEEQRDHVDLKFIGTYLGINLENGTIPPVIKVSGVNSKKPLYSFHLNH